MKHAYIVKLYYPNNVHFNMPYLFTSKKNAYAYGEYEFRESYDLKYYEVEQINTICEFYKLK